MKRILIFVVIVIGLDWTIGFVLNRLNLRNTTGDFSGGLINLALQQHPDVLIVGSSRARHHLIPKILHDHLSLTIYNAGIGGQDFLSSMMLLDLWTKKFGPPKIILIQMDPQSLYKTVEDQRTGIFSCYLDDSELVKNIIFSRGPYERLKYLSRSYRFNGRVIPIIRNLISRPEHSEDGYVGLIGELEPEAVPDLKKPRVLDGDAGPFLDEKVRYLTDLAHYCMQNGTKLILFHSPSFNDDPRAVARWMRNLSNLPGIREGAEIFDISGQINAQFYGRRDLYCDRIHLNSHGAALYSVLMANDLGAKYSAKPPQAAANLPQPKVLSGRGAVVRLPLVRT